jgi:hypothetical protein
MVADLDIEVAGRHGPVCAHLGHDAGGGLVLDVDKPVEFRRLLGGGRRSMDMAESLPPGLLADLAMQVRSAGRIIARVTPKPGGGLRLRPTPAGLWIAVRAGSAPFRRRAVAGAGIVLGLVVQRRIRQRRKAASQH